MKAKITCRKCANDFLVAAGEIFVFSASVLARCPDCKKDVIAPAPVSARLFLTLAGATAVTGKNQSFQFKGGILIEGM